VGTYDPAISPEVHAILNETIEVLEAEGATVVDDTRILIEDAYGPEFEALLCEFKDDIAAYLQAYTAAGYPKTLQDLLDFNNTHPELEGPWNSVLFEWALETGGRADADCIAAREAATSIAQAAIDDTMAANDLDAIIGPTNGPAWVTDPVNGDDFTAFASSSSPSAIAGYPAITVPAAYAGPLPLGVSFIAGRWDEPKLVGYAYAFEQATHVRVPPQFLASTMAAAASSTRDGHPATTDRPGHGRMLPLR
jgi:amidase